MVIAQKIHVGSLLGGRFSVGRSQSHNLEMFAIISTEKYDATREMKRKSDEKRRRNEGIDGRDGPCGCALSLSAICCQSSPVAGGDSGLPTCQPHRHHAQHPGECDKAFGSSAIAGELTGKVSLSIEFALSKMGVPFEALIPYGVMLGVSFSPTPLSQSILTVSQMFAFSGGALSKLRHMQNGGKRARYSIDQWDRVCLSVMTLAESRN